MALVNNVHTRFDAIDRTVPGPDVPDMPSVPNDIVSNVWTGRRLPLAHTMLLHNYFRKASVKTATAAGLGKTFGSKGRSGKSQGGDEGDVEEEHV